MNEYTADAQSGVVMFLQGETYGSSLNVGHLELERKFLKTPRSKEEAISFAEQDFAREAEVSMCANGLSERCFSCPHFKSEVKSFDDARTLTRSFRQTIFCRVRGCDQAREECLKKHDDLQKTGLAKIDIEVEYTPAEPIEYDHGSGRVFLGRGFNPYDKIKLTPISLPAIAMRDEWEVIEKAFIEPSFQQVEKKPSRAQKAAALKELNELFDLNGLSSTPDAPTIDYGVQVW